MNMTEYVESIQKQITTAQERESIYKGFLGLFEKVEFPPELYIYAWENSARDKVYFEFSPNKSQSQDLKPFIKSLAKHLRMQFKANRQTDSIDFRGEKKVSDTLTLIINVRSVVPGTCRVEESVRKLSAVEFAEAKHKALAEVKDFVVERKIICTDADGKEIVVDDPNGK